MTAPSTRFSLLGQLWFQVLAGTLLGALDRKILAERLALPALQPVAA